MRKLLVQQYPFLFVDESQDTAENVVLSLKAVDKELGDHFCLGFFGDPMQRIYTTGIGSVPAGEGWANITKPENFRCPATVLRVANAIRRDADGLVQTRGRMIGAENAQVSVPGSAHLFIFPAEEKRDQRIAQVRLWAAMKNDDPAWRPDEGDNGVRLLVIVHRMAANRLGFGNLYAALNDDAPESFKNGFPDGTAWPVRHFRKFIMPIVSASRKGDEFEVMQVLRSHSPLLARDNLRKVNVAERLSELRQLTETLQRMMEPGAIATNADVLRYVYQSKVIVLDPRVLAYLNLPIPPESAKTDDAQPPEKSDDGEELTKEVSAMDAFLACRASEFWGYYHYVNDLSPFSTQQGIKGAEFERVLVVLDDDEGTHVQFSYEKYFGIKKLSDRDLANRAEGKETAVERTRRLFYVCCTRALKDLIVILFTTDVPAAQRQITALRLFPTDAIHLKDEIAAY